MVVRVCPGRGGFNACVVRACPGRGGMKEGGGVIGLRGLLRLVVGCRCECGCCCVLPETLVGCVGVAAGGLSGVSVCSL